LQKLAGAALQFLEGLRADVSTIPFLVDRNGSIGPAAPRYADRILPFDVADSRYRKGQGAIRGVLFTPSPEPLN
jgi:hypothetical protein